MATLTLNLPDDLVAHLGSGDPASDVVRIVALQLFRDGKLSLTKAAAIADSPLEEFKTFAQRHGERPPDFVDSDERLREQRAIEYLDSLDLPTPAWLDRAWRAAHDNGTDELTADDIHQEIAASRRERRERTHLEKH